VSAIRSILFPTDLSPAADAVLPHATLLAEALDARLVLFHVSAIPVSEYAAWGAGKEDEVWSRVDGAARRALEERSRQLGTKCEIVVRHDTQSARILVDLSVLDQIKRSGADLVVMPMQSRSGFSRFFVGSVTEEVVHHAAVPVLAIRHPSARPGGRYRRILVATDLSGASRSVFPAAAAIASRFGSSVTAIHVAGDDQGPETGEEAVRAFLRPDWDAASVRIAEGAPWRAIVRAAEEEDADLVAIARRGADSLGEDILGSTTDRVLRRSPCPVLVG
jgi:nucleotide-binding universal stress UspA family protein